MSKKTLYPAQAPIKISAWKLVLMSIAFALAFFVLGYFTMHYPINMGWI